ncbi:Outer membrane receptor proteins, mostly Fe transport [Aquiflexum balticum DSM 16537]|uniref:Outer membrane receptor proteins, mostly Fe transport n=1 Tax=Aquiflexum balticum DSM 16537 TaxID=758820 RepID=A0A1W2H173_9BACT|nr:outer membrane beta-barrel family protein [Aquiflexum balticum]SMD42631.1 Outer membrane receptor proteins, mostly Fe transport [Aquiflexum balticum DSM 16537]
MKSSTQIFVTLFFFFFGLSNLAAKEVAQINGQVKNQKGENIPFVNVALIEAESGSLLTGSVTDEEGVFKIESVRSGKVQLVVSSIGFETFKSDVFEIKPGVSKDFGILSIKEEIGNLSEVTVKANRPEITIEADKTIINVEGTVMAEGNTALDVIARSPGVYVDQNDNINLNGRSGVIVMINDRQTYMSANDLANFLRTMPADNIKSIELINNPTSNFDAEGSAGIINIKLKKNNIDGMFGNVQVGGLYNGLFAPNTGMSLNMKKGKWTNNASLNYNEYNFHNDLNINRNFELSEGISNFDQNSRITMKNRNLFFTGGSDYEINSKHSLGVNVQLSENNGDNIGKSLTEINNPGTTDLFFIRSLNDADSENQRYFGNFHYIGLLDSAGTKLTTDVDYTRMRSNSSSLLTNNNWINENEIQSQRDYILTLNDMDYSIFTAKVDFTKPFGKGRVLETGLKGSWVKSDNILDLSKAIEEEPFTPDPNSNYFIYEENVLAAYALYKSKFSEKVSFQAGLRTEYSDITGTSVTLDRVDKQNYIDLFPSLFVQHQVSKDYQIVYNANRRISRPNYRLLNPFVYYIDPLTTEQGNPNLRPQYAHNLEMNHVIQGAYQFTLGYSLTTDVFQQIFTQDEETRTTTTFTENLEKAQTWNFRTMIPVEIRPWWNTSNMLQINNSSWKSMIGDALLDVSQTSFTLRSQHTISLPAGFKAEVMGMYIGPSQYGQAFIKGFGWVDAGLSKSIMKDKMTISVNGTDLFRTQFIRANVQFDNIDTRFEQYRSNQGIRFTLRYKFAQGENFRVSNRSGSAEERNRLD